MQGFVPVNKTDLLEMVSNCRAAIVADFEENTAERIARYIKSEQERMQTRRWYRLWMLPAARFAFNDESVKEYSANRQYEMFSGCPLNSLQQDKDNSGRWLDKIERLATSHYAGEPIQLDTKTFLRLSSPEKYHLVHIGMCYTLDYS